MGNIYECGGGNDGGDICFRGGSSGGRIAKIVLIPVPTSHST